MTNGFYFYDLYAQHTPDFEVHEMLWQQFIQKYKNIAFSQYTIQKQHY